MTRLPKHSWMKKEEITFVECLVKLVNGDGWRSNYETFKPRCATRGQTETFGNVGSNELGGYEGFTLMLHTIWSLMYSQGLDMSPDEVMGIRTARVNDDRHISSGSEHKWEGQSVDNMNVIHNAIKYDNEQLNRIVD
ncbi:retrotransposon protein [Cucumis melo var. makuwa]|uniref:Retrotransposon protein n=1 Tax=Cucumis melo var. makuwa TaxID=1194695 RepID=A0A5A7T7F7_CUCMM|nr:retrotransposon protein [Cucumis melo var. makuwa]TYJ97516.1 retrotransposon protein [Cucumis melo var. makuwa]